MHLVCKSESWRMSKIFIKQCMCVKPVCFFRAIPVIQVQLSATLLLAAGSVNMPAYFVFHKKIIVILPLKLAGHTFLKDFQHCLKEIAVFILELYVMFV